MGKIILITTLVLCCSMYAGAQTTAEIFNQKKTQRKYLLQQIAAIALMRSLQKKGRTETQRGWSNVETIRKTEKAQHKNYYQKEGYEKEEKDNGTAAAGNHGGHR
jgi:hypothetical protein